MTTINTKIQIYYFTFLVGKYRDKSMAFGIVEYRHMFGTQEQYDMGKLLSKFGFVAWVGTGTIGKDPADWDKWKLNYGVGLRIQIQPGRISVWILVAVPVKSWDSI